VAKVTTRGHAIHTLKGRVDGIEHIGLNEGRILSEVVHFAPVHIPSGVYTHLCHGNHEREEGGHGIPVRAKLGGFREHNHGTAAGGG